MSENKFDIQDTSLAVDINEETQAVKENRFDNTLKLFTIHFQEHHTNIATL